MANNAPAAMPAPMNKMAGGRRRSGSRKGRSRRSRNSRGRFTRRR